MEGLAYAQYAQITQMVSLAFIASALLILDLKWFFCDLQQEIAGPNKLDSGKARAG